MTWKLKAAEGRQAGWIVESLHATPFKSEPIIRVDRAILPEPEAVRLLEFIGLENYGASQVCDEADKVADLIGDLDQKIDRRNSDTYRSQVLEALEPFGDPEKLATLPAWALAYVWHKFMEYIAEEVRSSETLARGIPETINPRPHWHKAAKQMVTRYARLPASQEIAR